MPRAPDSHLEQSWEYATWEGSELAMIRRNLKLTIRQRLEEMQQLNDLCERLATMPKRQAAEPPDDDSGSDDACR